MGRGMGDAWQPTPLWRLMWQRPCMHAQLAHGLPLYIPHPPCLHDTDNQEICRDIKKLDYAKKHLTATITALRRLSMLVNAVGACRLARCANGIP